MLPTLAMTSDTEHRQMADTIAAAVAHSRVPRVVMLSSIGADLARGTVPIRWLHNRLRDSGAIMTAIRSPHFREKVETLLPAATGDVVYPVFGDNADVRVPMVSTCDVGAAVAEFLMSPPASQVIDLDAPSYSENNVARPLGSGLGRGLQVATIPRAGWLDTLPAPGCHRGWQPSWSSCSTLTIGVTFAREADACTGRARLGDSAGRARLRSAAPRPRNVAESVGVRAQRILGERPVARQAASSTSPVTDYAAAADEPDCPIVARQLDGTTRASV
jgi:hypothetical protein